jgi:type IV pilus assembly protein PilV
MNLQSKQLGFSMVEILVTIVVIAIGLLGLAGLQATSLRNTEASYQRSQAATLAYDMLDRMRANAAGVSNGDYDSITAAPTGTVKDCTSNTCDKSEMATFDNDDWHTNITAVLPSGTGTVSGSGAGSVFTITITWDDDRDSTTTAASFTLSSRVS